MLNLFQQATFKRIEFIEHFTRTYFIKRDLIIRGTEYGFSQQEVDQYAHLSTRSLLKDHADDFRSWLYDYAPYHPGLLWNVALVLGELTRQNETGANIKLRLRDGQVQEQFNNIVNFDIAGARGETKTWLRWLRTQASFDQIYWHMARAAKGNDEAL